MPKKQQNNFLFQECEMMLLEINCPSEYILNLFVKELILEEYCINKVQYRRSKNFLIAYRGCLFLIERQFEVILNVFLFKQIFSEQEWYLRMLMYGNVLLLPEIQATALVWQ